MRRLARLILRKPESARGKAPPPLAPRILLFDFDGTIADTFEAGFEILNILAGEFGFRGVTRDELPKVRAMRVGELLTFLEVPKTRLPRIAKRAAEELRRRIHEVQPLPDMLATTRELHRRGYRLGIVTSNTEENVSAFLRNHDLEIFDAIHCSSKLLGKARMIRGALRQAGFKGREALFIGDEMRDIEACQKARVPVVAVTWGYGTLEALGGLNPDFLVESPARLLDLLPGPDAPPTISLPTRLEHSPQYASGKKERSQ